MSEFLTRENYFQLAFLIFLQVSEWVDWFPSCAAPSSAAHHWGVQCHQYIWNTEIFFRYGFICPFPRFFFSHAFSCHPYETLRVKESFLVRKAANSNGGEISEKGNLKMQNTYKNGLCSKVKDPSPSPNSQWEMADATSEEFCWSRIWKETGRESICISRCIHVVKLIELFFSDGNKILSIKRSFSWKVVINLSYLRVLETCWGDELKKMPPGVIFF